MKCLKVPQNTSDEEIRQQCLELMKSQYPDKVSQEGLYRSQKNNEAYEVLGGGQREIEEINYKIHDTNMTDG
ncbi:MAG: J domain-containing protein [Candidatus Dadabacteria bacterium]|nr:J domain-containing protein [Candidatus Dadabacteria bacterium]MCH8014064.1 J domain-containing protein [Candidatus Dadabacteria bacterium]